MAGFSESSTIQAAVLDRLTQPDLGWQFVEADKLGRDKTDVLLEADVVEALQRLNPILAEKPHLLAEVMPKLRAVVLSVHDDGLVTTNERLMSWLRGNETVQFVGEQYPIPIRLIDFDDPRSNRLVVSMEVWFKAGGEKERRYDLVLYVNGFPLVIGETKTPVKDKKSWLNAALDITRDVRGEEPGDVRAERVLVRDRGQGLPLRPGRAAGGRLAAVGLHRRRADADRPEAGAAQRRAAAHSGADPRDAA